MKAGGVGGGNTVSGIHFETRCDLITCLEQIPGYEVRSLVGRAGQASTLKANW